MDLNQLLKKNTSLAPLILSDSEIDAYPYYSALRTEAPVFRDASGMWFVAAHEQVMQVLRNADGVFDTKPSEEAYACMPRAIYRQSGETLKRLRTVFSSYFGPAAINALRPTIELDAATLIRTSTTAEGCNVSHVAWTLAIGTLRKIIGIAPADLDAWLNAATPVARLMRGVHPDRAEQERLVGQADAFTLLVRRFVDGIERHGPDTHPIRQLLAAEGTDLISRDEIVDNLIFLFIVGFGTTARSIANTVAGIALADGLWSTCAEERDLVPKVVKELLRYDGAAQGAVRHATRDVELGGKLIRRGERLLLLLGAANRDPQAFLEPDHIDLDRPSGAHVAFGAGAHACIGRALATVEVEIALGALLDAMPRAAVDLAKIRRQHQGLVAGYAQLWLRQPDEASDQKNARRAD